MSELTPLAKSVWRHYYGKLKKQTRGGKLSKQLDGYLPGDRRESKLPLLFRGTNKKEVENLARGRFRSKWGQGDRAPAVYPESEKEVREAIGSKSLTWVASNPKIAANYATHRPREQARIVAVARGALKRRDRAVSNAIGATTTTAPLRGGIAAKEARGLLKGKPPQDTFMATSRDWRWKPVPLGDIQKKQFSRIDRGVVAMSRRENLAKQRRMDPIGREAGIPLTGQIAHDRYVIENRQKDIAKRDSNILRAGIAGTAAGAVLGRGRLPLKARLAVGALAGAGSVIGVRAVTQKTGRDVYGARQPWAARSEAAPAVIGAGAAGYGAYRILRKKFLKMSDARKVTELAEKKMSAAQWKKATARMPDDPRQKAAAKWLKKQGHNSYVNWGWTDGVHKTYSKKYKTEGDRLLIHEEDGKLNVRRAGDDKLVASFSSIEFAEKKRQMNPYVMAGLSGAASGAALGILPLLRRGVRLRTAARTAAGGAAAGGAIVGGGSLLGSSILGDPDNKEGAAFTKRAAVGGAIVGGTLGVAGGLAARRVPVVKQAIRGMSKEWRPAMWIRQVGPARAAAIGGVAGGAYGAGTGADEGQQVDSIRNIRKDLKRMHGLSAVEFSENVIIKQKRDTLSKVRDAAQLAASLGVLGLAGYAGLRTHNLYKIARRKIPQVATAIEKEAPAVARSAKATLRSIRKASSQVSQTSRDIPAKIDRIGTVIDDGMLGSGGFRAAFRKKKELSAIMFEQEKKRNLATTAILTGTAAAGAVAGTMIGLRGGKAAVRVIRKADRDVRRQALRVEKTIKSTARQVGGVATKAGETQKSVRESTRMYADVGRIYREAKGGLYNLLHPVNTLRETKAAFRAGLQGKSYYPTRPRPEWAMSSASELVELSVRARKNLHDVAKQRIANKLKKNGNIVVVAPEFGQLWVGRPRTEFSEKPFSGYNKKRHARTGGLNDRFRQQYNREHGSKLKRPVTTEPSKLKPGSKAAKRRASFCARMGGMQGPTSKDGKLTPKGAALKRWNCEAEQRLIQMNMKARAMSWGDYKHGRAGFEPWLRQHLAQNRSRVGSTAEIRSLRQTPAIKEILKKENARGSIRQRVKTLLRVLPFEARHEFQTMAQGLTPEQRQVRNTLLVTGAVVVPAAAAGYMAHRSFREADRKYGEILNRTGMRPADVYAGSRRTNRVLALPAPSATRGDAPRKIKEAYSTGTSWGVRTIDNTGKPSAKVLSRQGGGVNVLPMDYTRSRYGVRNPKVIVPPPGPRATEAMKLRADRNMALKPIGQKRDPKMKPILERGKRLQRIGSDTKKWSRGERKAARATLAMLRKRYGFASAASVTELDIYARNKKTGRASGFWDYTRGEELVGRDKKAVDVTLPAFIGAAQREATTGWRYARRAGGLAQDLGEVASGQKTKKREWEKGWFRNAVAVGGMGAGLLAHGLIYRSGKINPRAPRWAKSYTRTVDDVGEKINRSRLSLMKQVNRSVGLSARLKRISLDYDAAMVGWDVRDPRGRSARVFAPGARPRYRRQADWHETKDGQRKVLIGAGVLGALATGAGGILVGRRIGQVKTLVKRRGIYSGYQKAQQNKRVIIPMFPSAS